MSVEDVHLEVPLLAGADVAAMRTMPASKSLHDDNISEAILKDRVDEIAPVLQVVPHLVPAAKPVHLVRQTTELLSVRSWRPATPT